jgi:glutathione S-transferase
MKPIIAAPSPYARVVRVSIHEKTIEHEIIVYVPWFEDTFTKDKNPLGKVPILITNENKYIFYSKVIIRYLDQIKPKPEIYPIDTKNHLSALTIETVADGICYSIILIHLENVRVKNLISKKWIKRQENKIVNGLNTCLMKLVSKAIL